MNSFMRMLFMKVRMRKEERVYQMGHFNFYKIGVSDFLKLNIHPLKFEKKNSIAAAKLLDFVKIGGVFHSSITGKWYLFNTGSKHGYP